MGVAVARPVELAPGSQRRQRIAVCAVAGVSAVFVVLDLVGNVLAGRRADLSIELTGRILMLALAVLAARKTRGDRNMRLLLWAVVLVSFDTYWQNTYRYLGGRSLEWFEMLAKYVAVPTGLGLLLRFCASYGRTAHDRGRHAPPDRLGDWLAKHAIWISGILSVIGIVHGSLYIASCSFFVPSLGQCVVSQPAVIALNAYLAANAMVRVAIAVAAVTGFARARTEFKQRTLLIAFASVMLPLGTVAHFAGRLASGPEATAPLAVLDAVTTFLFPIVLLYASTRNELFDVEYVVHRFVVGAVAAGIVLLAWAIAGTSALMTVFGLGCGLIGLGTAAPKVITGIVLATPQGLDAYREVLETAKRWPRTLVVHLATVLVAATELAYHHFAEKGAEKLEDFVPTILHGPQSQPILHWGILLIAVFAWITLMEIIDHPIAEAFPSAQRKRAKELNVLSKRILLAQSHAELKHLLHDALSLIWVKFVDILLRDGRGGFKSYLSTRNDPPACLGPSVVSARFLKPSEWRRLGGDDPDIPGCDLLVSLAARGEHYGLLICGKPTDVKPSKLARHEADAALHQFVLAAGNALCLHDAAKAAAPEEVRS